MPNNEVMHFGVKGMKWGVSRNRKATSTTRSGPTRRDLRAMDKKNRAADREKAKAEAIKANQKRDAEIDAARKRWHENSRKDYLAAKAKYKNDKKLIGKYAAKKAFDAVKEKNMQDYEIAQQVKSGRETTNALIAEIGMAALSGVTARR